jgi:hypothetical protein
MLLTTLNAVAPSLPIDPPPPFHAAGASEEMLTSCVGKSESHSL